MCVRVSVNPSPLTLSESLTFVLQLSLTWAFVALLRSPVCALCVGECLVYLNKAGIVRVILVSWVLYTANLRPKLKRPLTTFLPSHVQTCLSPLSVHLSIFLHYYSATTHFYFSFSSNCVIVSIFPICYSVQHQRVCLFAVFHLWHEFPFLLRVS